IESKDLIKISTKTQKVKIKKYEDETNYKEWEEIIEGECQLLTETLQNIVDNEKENLILLTAYRNAINLQQDIQQTLNLIRKQKALPLIENYQIIVATATFANPVSSLDLLATAAINTQMIVDLSTIYQQSLSLNQAQEISIALGKLMVKLGIVEISTQAITTILKTNIVTFVAGGIIQGISAAYLTRICGLSLIEYYEVTDSNNNEAINMTKIKEKLQLIFQKNKENNFLTNFVKKTALQFQNI
ncbi:YcjF family protein, partial [Geminocystis sp. GBBB08]|uniref:YcjF family protein n=1 Tax=Geminocystis sp. GBBB08 TaxID=2604140 RepID=UPI0027E2DBDE